MSNVLGEEKVNATLKKMSDWEVEGDGITRTIEFEGFSEAVDFVNDLAEIAEKAEHHPDIQIQYNKVILHLTTHDAGGITDQDLELAQSIDNLID